MTSARRGKAIPRRGIWSRDSLPGALRSMPPKQRFPSLSAATQPTGRKKGSCFFARLFTILNQERSQVMNGLERFSRQQAAFANRIRVEISELRELQDTPGGDERKLDELANRIDWDTRIFEERRKTISYACEVPVLIEQRLFALARAIQQAIE